MGNFNDRTWERLFDFVFADEKSLTRDQIQDELRRHGIDIGQIKAQVQATTAMARAAGKEGQP